MDERYLSPKARRRREIIADVELAISCLIGFAWGVLGTLLIMMAFGVV